MTFKYFVIYLFILCQVTESQITIEVNVSFDKEPNVVLTRQHLNIVPTIVGGFRVIKGFPYQAQFGICSASIISERWIITAAHCPDASYISAGSHFHQKGNVTEVKKLYRHPGYMAKKKIHDVDYDYMLVELKEPLKFSPGVQPVKIGRLQDLAVGKMINVSGWGRLVQDVQEYSPTLQAVELPIVGNETCRKIRDVYYRDLTPRMFCAGFKYGKKDACQGDSGGPAVSGGRLLGIVSFGRGCARPDNYGVYSNVVAVRDWIHKVTGIELD